VHFTLPFYQYHYVSRQVLCDNRYHCFQYCNDMQNRHFVNKLNVLMKQKISQKTCIWDISGTCNKKLAARRFRTTHGITRHTALQLFSCIHNRCHCDIMVFWTIRWFRKLQSNLLYLCPQMTVLNSCGCCCDLRREMYCSFGTSLTWISESIYLAQDLSHPTFLNLWLSTILPNFSIISEHFLLPSTEPNTVSRFICSK